MTSFFVIKYTYLSLIFFFYTGTQPFFLHCCLRGWFLWEWPPRRLRTHQKTTVRATVAFTPAFVVTIVRRGKERTLFGIENFRTQRKKLSLCGQFCGQFRGWFHGQFCPTVTFTPALVTIVQRGKEQTLFGIENFRTQRKNFRFVDSFVGRIYFCIRRILSTNQCLILYIDFGVKSWRKFVYMKGQHNGEFCICHGLCVVGAPKFEARV